MATRQVPGAVCAQAALPHPPSLLPSLPSGSVVTREVRAVGWSGCERQRRSLCLSEAGPVRGGLSIGENPCPGPAVSAGTG